MFFMEQINFFGRTNFRNQDVRFGIKPDDRRRHMYIIGQTGTGKSTLLENLAINDIRNGNGLAIIDPHGEFAEKMLDFIPENRIDDVIYFNPADMKFPVAFNPLEQVNSDFRHLVASSVMGVFKKIWVDAWSARMEYILNNTLLALLEYPNSTLLDVMRMFSDKDYRNRIVDGLKDPVIKSYWTNEFAKYTEKLSTEAVSAIQNKVGQFVSNPLIRNIIGQPRSTMDMRDIMDKNKIFIGNLSKGRVGEDNSALLGGMLITKFQLAAMSRVDIPMDDRKDFYLYVDEFQNFSTESFAGILSEARKYRLNLILAHQYIDQLSDEVRSAVFGNVGTTICYRVGSEDGEFLERQFAPTFTTEDLVNLPNYHMYLRLMIDGVSSRPFSAKALPPIKMEVESLKDVIIENSRRKYALPQEDVEERIAKERLTVSKDIIQEKTMRREEKSLREVFKKPGQFARPSQFVKKEFKKEPEDELLQKDKKTINIEDLRKTIEESLKKRAGDQNKEEKENK